MPLFANCDPEALSDTAGKEHRWEFLITAAPTTDRKPNKIAAKLDTRI